ncbi:Immunity protein 50 [Caenorhabditis elegans]|uniref:Immunity protein 50 n=1 Tax=Caenorhabditis elegans TaxID=6239 RepID=Q95X26_CAEEL|nr:Immunity protein 50 [Caenorhabditis elegans]CCD71452.1 Immunity protein 50 [Caenorhabditis elegans]|eukprot:NP_740969.1 Uncharacterized protein CELE_Y57G7A.11 [Caenorhabditis elegans]
MKGWYETRGNTFYIWEGVLATYRPENLAVCQLFKIMENEIFEIHVDFSTEFPDFSIEKIDSEGYWECVEIRGVLSTGAHFLCHSTSKSHAMSILKVLPSAITEISVRLDPDPLRNWEKPEIKERISDWQEVLTLFCEFPENSKIILDSNMLS